MRIFKKGFLLGHFYVLREKKIEYKHSSFFIVSKGIVKRMPWKRELQLLLKFLSVLGKHCKRMCFSILGCEIKGLDKQRGVSFCVEFLVLIPYIFKDSLT
jgi:hypothetical protein